MYKMQSPVFDMPVPSTYSLKLIPTGLFTCWLMICRHNPIKTGTTSANKVLTDVESYTRNSSPWSHLFLTQFVLLIFLVSLFLTIFTYFCGIIPVVFCSSYERIDQFLFLFSFIIFTIEIIFAIVI